MIHNEAEAICARLSTLDGVQRVTRGWPASFARLPCIAVSKAADMPVAFADDGERIAQLEYYIRIFTSGAQQADMLAEAADAVVPRPVPVASLRFGAESDHCFSRCDMVQCP